MSMAAAREGRPFPSSGEIGMDTTKIKLDEIGNDPKLQPREAIDGRPVAQYAEAMRAGAHFPPVLIYRVSDRLGWFLLAHGFHRYHASKEAGRPTIEAEVMDGTYDDARWAAAGSNKEWDGVGMPRGDGDKRRAVRMAWEARPGAKQTQIAEQVGVRQSYVSDLIKKWKSQCYQTDSNEIHTSVSNGADDDDPDVIDLLPPLSEEARAAYLEKEREHWPSEMAARNWNKAMHDIAVELGSIRRAGGVEALTQDWHPERIRQLLGTVRDIGQLFKEMEDEIEIRLSTRD
jgi:hypothetical protein